MKKLILALLMTGFVSGQAFALGETSTRCDRSVSENRFVEGVEVAKTTQEAPKTNSTNSARR